MTKVTGQARFGGRKLAALLGVGAAFGVATCLANPFDDVKYMFSGGVDADGNGVLTHNSSELRCITKAGDPTHAWHTTTYPDSNLPLFRLQNLDVPCTYANMTLANAPCLVMPQPVTTNGWEEITVNGNTFNSPNVTVKANYLKLPDLLSDWTGDRANMSCSNYTFIARFRRDEAVADNLNLMSNFFMPGYDWGTQKGISVIFMGQTGAKTRYLQIKGGKEDWKHSSNQNVPDGAWCEIAVIVTAPSVSAAICWSTNNVHTPLQWGSHTYNAANVDCSIIPSRRTFRLCGEASGEQTFVQGSTPSGNISKCFRGAIHTFAFWDRALTREEAQEALAASRPGVVKQGFKNGSSDEFTKAQDSVTEGVRWEEWNPVLNAAHPSASVTFNVNTMYGGLPQYLFLTPVPTGAGGTLDITIDGNRVANKHFATGRTGVVYVPGSFLAAGSHTIAFRRTDTAGGDFAIDAFEIRGSWQVGYDRNGGADAAFVAEDNKNHTYYMTDGNSKHLKRGYTIGAGQNTTWLYFDVPRELCDSQGRCRADATFYSRPDQAGSSDPHSFSLLVNGETFSNVTWTAYMTNPKMAFTIPSGTLTNGMNCIAWQKTNSGGWIKCACYRLTFDKIPNGTTMIVR